MKCPTQKRLYYSEVMAEDALIEARIRFVNNSAVGVYQCDDCGQWHLTSQGPLNARLKSMLDDGSISRENDAINWERKFRR